MEITQTRFNQEKEIQNKKQQKTEVNNFVSKYGNMQRDVAFKSDNKASNATKVAIGVSVLTGIGALFGGAIYLFKKPNNKSIVEISNKIAKNFNIVNANSDLNNVSKNNTIKILIPETAKFIKFAKPIDNVNTLHRGVSNRIPTEISTVIELSNLNLRNTIESIDNNNIPKYIKDNFEIAGSKDSFGAVQLYFIPKNVDTSKKAEFAIQALDSSEKDVTIANTRPTMLFKEDLKTIDKSEHRNLFVEYDSQEKNLIGGRVIAHLMLDSLNNKNGVPVASNLPFGGNFDDLIKKINSGEFNKTTDFLLLPVFKDSMSKHKYLCENMFQIDPTLGGEEGYRELIKTMANKGQRIINDFPGINEGVMGLHYQDTLRRGKASPFYEWFDINETSGRNQGILPDDLQNVGARIVNSPNSSSYNHNKEIYIQIFDKRYTDISNQNDGEELITINNYKFNNKSDVASLTRAGHCINPYSFPISASEAAKIKRTNDGSIDLNQLNFNNFHLTQTSKQSTNTWDGSSDLMKLSYFIDNGTKPLDSKQILKKAQATFQVRDNALQSLRYHTRLTRNIYLETIAKEAKANSNTLSTKYNIDGKLINAAKYGNYSFTNINLFDSSDVTILKEIMDFPLAKLDLPNDTLAIADSAYISKKASNETYLGVSRYDISQGFNNSKPYEHIPLQYQTIYKQMDEFYAKQMLGEVKSILKKVDSEILDKEDNLTEFGRHALPLIMDDINKFLLYKSLDPSIEFTSTSDNTAKFILNKTNLTLKAMNSFNVNNPEIDANNFVSHLKKGIKKISYSDKEQFIKILNDRLKDLNLDSMRISNMIIDQAQLGSGYRLDAAKDYANINSIKNGEEKPDLILSQLINFISLIQKNITLENRNALVFGELTDIDKIVKDPVLNSVYNSPALTSYLFRKDANITQADFTTSYPMRNIFSKIDPSNGKKSGYHNNLSLAISEKVTNSNKNWTHQAGEVYDFARTFDKDTIIKFSETQDIARLMHQYALDMEIFTANIDKNTSLQTNIFETFINNCKDAELLKSLKKPNMEDINQKDAYNYSAISSKSIAMGFAIKKQLDALKNKIDPNHYNEIMKSLSKIVLKTGKNNDNFGLIPIHMAVDEMLKGTNIDKNICLNIRKNIVSKMCEEPYKNIIKLQKIITTEPGSHSIYADMKYGGSGWESPSHNSYGQNRNVLLDKNSTFIEQSLIKDFENQVENLRSNKHLKALVNGNYSPLPSTDKNYFAKYRETKDSQIICVSKNPATTNEKLTHIVIYQANPDNDPRQAGRQIEAGAKFKRYNAEEGSLYKDETYIVKYQKYQKNDVDNNYKWTDLKENDTFDSSSPEYRAILVYEKPDQDDIAKILKKDYDTSIFVRVKEGSQN